MFIPKGSIFGGENKSFTLYVRECYKDIYDLIMKGFIDYEKVLLIGTSV